MMLSSDEWALDALPEALPWIIESLTTDAPRRQRAASDLVREFEHDKWGSLWDKLDDVNSPTLDSVEEVFYSDANRPITIGDRRVLGSPPLATEALALRTAQLMAEFAPDSRSLVELGVGYGAFGLRIARSFKSRPVEVLGVDMSQTALRLLAAVSHAEGIRTSVEVWDLDNPVGLGTIIPQNSVVVTCNSLMYASSPLAPLLREIASSRPSLVVHAEPLVADQGLDLLGLLTSRYIRQNGYSEQLSEDIYSFLAQESNRFVLRAHEPRVAGMNPLLPTSIIAWGPLTNAEAQSSDGLQQPGTSG